MCHDLLLSRYGGGYSEVINIQFLDAYELIAYMIKQKSEELVLKRWINGYQSMSLNDFKDNIGYRRDYEVEDKEVDEILQDLKSMFG